MFNNIKREVDVCVIGGGIFGCLAAIELSKRELSVLLLEKDSRLMCGATLNNQNRLHLGYHYPRDINTAEQCIKGFFEFKKEFFDCILSNFENLYFISNQGSKVNFTQYKNFCESVGLPFDSIEELNFIIQSVEGGINTSEVVYDANILKDLVLSRLDRHDVDIKTKSLVSAIREEHDCFILDIYGRDSVLTNAVVNCTYSNYNMFNKMLGVKARKFQYELTVVPIIRWHEEEPPIGITVMDGPFFTLLPFGKTGHYLLYDVTYSNIDTQISRGLPTSWADSRKMVTGKIAERAFGKMVSNASRWLPSIEEASFVDYLTSPRIVFPNSDKTDKRPSIIETLPLRNCFINVFSGKIDHSIWVAREVAQTVEKSVNVGAKSTLPAAFGLLP